MAKRRDSPAAHDTSAPLPHGRHGLSSVGRRKALELAARHTGFVAPLLQRRQDALSPTSTSAFWQTLRRRLIAPGGPTLVRGAPQAGLSVALLQRYAAPLATFWQRDRRALTGHRDLHTLLAALPRRQRGAWIDDDAELEHDAAVGTDDTALAATAASLLPSRLPDLAGASLLPTWLPDLAGAPGEAWQEAGAGPLDAGARIEGAPAGRLENLPLVRPVDLPLVRPVAPILVSRAASDTVLSPLVARMVSSTPAPSVPAAATRDAQLPAWQRGLPGQQEWLPPSMTNAALPLAVGWMGQAAAAAGDGAEARAEAGAETGTAFSSYDNRGGAPMLATGMTLPQTLSLVASIRRRAEPGLMALNATERVYVTEHTLPAENWPLPVSGDAREAPLATPGASPAGTGIMTASGASPAGTGIMSALALPVSAATMAAALPASAAALPASVAAMSVAVPAPTPAPVTAAASPTMVAVGSPMLPPGAERAETYGMVAVQQPIFGEPVPLMPPGGEGLALRTTVAGYAGPLLRAFAAGQAGSPLRAFAAGSTGLPGLAPPVPDASSTDAAPSMPGTIFRGATYPTPMTIATAALPPAPMTIATGPLLRALATGYAWSAPAPATAGGTEALQPAALVASVPPTLLPLARQVPGALPTVLSMASSAWLSTLRVASGHDERLQRTVQELPGEEGWRPASGPAGPPPLEPSPRIAPSGEVAGWRQEVALWGREGEVAAGVLPRLSLAPAFPSAATPEDSPRLGRRVGGEAGEAVGAAAFTALPQILSLAASIQRKAEPGAMTPTLQRRTLAVEQAVRSEGRPLDHGTREVMETALGGDFTGVRIHTDHAAASAASTLSAQAFTLGSSVYFARGAFEPASPSGLALLGHELVHTTQQSTLQRLVTPAEDAVGEGEEAPHLEERALHTEAALLRMLSVAPPSTMPAAAVEHTAMSPAMSVVFPAIPATPQAPSFPQAPSLQRAASPLPLTVSPPPLLVSPAALAGSPSPLVGPPALLIGSPLAPPAAPAPLAMSRPLAASWNRVLPATSLPLAHATLQPAPILAAAAVSGGMTVRRSITPSLYRDNSAPAMNAPTAYSTYSAPTATTLSAVASEQIASAGGTAEADRSIASLSTPTLRLDRAGDSGLAPGSIATSTMSLAPGSIAMSATGLAGTLINRYARGPESGGTVTIPPTTNGTVSGRTVSTGATGSTFVGRFPIAVMQRASTGSSLTAIERLSMGGSVGAVQRESMSGSLPAQTIAHDLAMWTTAPPGLLSLASYDGDEASAGSAGSAASMASVGPWGGMALQRFTGSMPLALLSGHTGDGTSLSLQRRIVAPDNASPQLAGDVMSGENIAGGSPAGPAAGSLPRPLSTLSYGPGSLSSLAQNQGTWADIASRVEAPTTGVLSWAPTTGASTAAYAIARMLSAPALAGSTPSLAPGLTSSTSLPTGSSERMSLPTGLSESTSLAAGLSGGTSLAVGPVGRMSLAGGPTGMLSRMAQEAGSVSGAAYRLSNGLGGVVSLAQALGSRADSAQEPPAATGGDAFGFPAQQDGGVVQRATAPLSKTYGTSGGGAYAARVVVPGGISGGMSGMAGSVAAPSFDGMGTLDGLAALLDGSANGAASMTYLQRALSDGATAESAAAPASGTAGTPAQPASASAESGAGAAPDMDKLIDQVIHGVRRQLALEHERAGGFLSDLMR